MSSTYSSVLTVVKLLAGADPIRPSPPSLDAALERLRSPALGASEAAALEQVIWHVWSHTGHPDAVRLLKQATESIAANDLSRGLRLLDDAVAGDPGFAEAWNRRATVLFMLDDAAASARDIERVIWLEPRHFGALSGLGQVLIQEGEAGAALDAFDAALSINPHLGRVRQAADRLRRKLGGHSGPSRLLH